MKVLITGIGPNDGRNENGMNCWSGVIRRGYRAPHFGEISLKIKF